MRLMYDGVSSLALGISKQFPDAALIAGYLDGHWAWDVTEWGLFPKSAHVGIVTSAGSNFGDVLDVEKGDATPAETAGWIAMRKASGLAVPTIYCRADTISAVRIGTGRWVLAEDYDIWVADWTGQPHQLTSSGPGIAAACAATQYEKTPGYDVSAVYDDRWPRRCG